MLFQIALTILEVNKERLMQCHDDGEAMMVLGGYFERITSRDAAAFMEHTQANFPSREKLPGVSDVVS